MLAQNNLPKFQKIRFKERDFFVLRDDLLDDEINGNKARKLEYFLNANLKILARFIAMAARKATL